eukprot:3830648-Prymnesium_polylepis.1
MVGCALLGLESAAASTWRARASTIEYGAMRFWSPGATWSMRGGRTRPTRTECVRLASDSPVACGSSGITWGSRVGHVGVIWDYMGSIGITWTWGHMGSHAGHMWVTCRSRAGHVQVTCRSHAGHVRVTCGSHAGRMRVACGSRAGH